MKKIKNQMSLSDSFGDIDTLNCFELLKEDYCNIYGGGGGVGGGTTSILLSQCVFESIKIFQEHPSYGRLLEAAVCGASGVYCLTKGAIHLADFTKQTIVYYTQPASVPVHEPRQLNIEMTANEEAFRGNTLPLASSTSHQPVTGEEQERLLTRRAGRMTRRNTPPIPEIMIPMYNVFNGEAPTSNESTARYEAWYKLKKTAAKAGALLTLGTAQLSYMAGTFYDILDIKFCKKAEEACERTKTGYYHNPILDDEGGFKEGRSFLCQKNLPLHEAKMHEAIDEVCANGAARGVYTPGYLPEPKPIEFTCKDGKPVYHT